MGSGQLSMYGWMDAWMHGWMYGCMYVRNSDKNKSEKLVKPQLVWGAPILLKYRSATDNNIEQLLSWSDGGQR